MYREVELFTVYEIYEQKDSTFPFWIRGTINSQTCTLVTGWSKIINSKTYQGVPILTVESALRDQPEAHPSKQEDFLETGSFVGICFFNDKKTPIHPQSKKLITVAAGSTRSWIPA